MRASTDKRQTPSSFVCFKRHLFDDLDGLARGFSRLEGVKRGFAAYFEGGGEKETREIWGCMVAEKATFECHRKGGSALSSKLLVPLFVSLRIQNF